MAQRGVDNISEPDVFRQLNNRKFIPIGKLRGIFRNDIKITLRFDPESRAAPFCHEADQVFQQLRAVLQVISRGDEQFIFM